MGKGLSVAVPVEAAPFQPTTTHVPNTCIRRRFVIRIETNAFPGPHGRSRATALYRSVVTFQNLFTLPVQHGAHRTFQERGSSWPRPIDRCAAAACAARAC